MTAALRAWLRGLAISVESASDILLIVGAVAIAAGAWELSEAWGKIVAGVLLLAMAVLGSLRSQLPKDGR